MAAVHHCRSIPGLCRCSQAVVHTGEDDVVLQAVNVAGILYSTPSVAIQECFGDSRSAVVFKRLPVEGSWRDPVLGTMGSLCPALTTLHITRGTSTPYVAIAAYSPVATLLEIRDSPQ